MSAFNQNRDSLPNCRSMIKLRLLEGNVSVNGFYLVSIVPTQDKSDELMLLMNGELFYSKDKVTISRKYVLSYRNEGEHFFLRVNKVFVNPTDTLTDDMNIDSIPKIGQTYAARAKWNAYF